MAEAFALAESQGVALGDAVAAAAWRTASAVVEGIAVDVVVFDREGRLRGRPSEGSANRELHRVGVRPAIAW